MNGGAFVSSLLLSLCTSVVGVNNGLARVPVGGYQSWNDLGHDVSEAAIKARADALVSLGLAALNYTYVCLDDVWAAGRYPDNNTLFPDPTRFPSGIPALVEYVHSKGLKLGLYTSLSNRTCSHKSPGSYGFIDLDAKTFADWGVDLLKVDTCIDYQYGGDDNLNVTYPGFHDWGVALNKTGRPIYYSMCGKSYFSSIAAQWANSWRMAQDDFKWGYYLGALHVASDLSIYAGPGGWTDLDMLNPSTATDPKFGYTAKQSRSQFTLNCLLGSPLFMSVNLNALSPWDLDTYSNRELVEVSADSRGIPGVQVWGGPVTGAWGDSSSRDLALLETCGQQEGSLVYDRERRSLTDVTTGSALELHYCFPRPVFGNATNTKCCQLPDHKMEGTSSGLEDTVCPHQQWELNPAPAAGTVTVRSRMNGLCLVSVGSLLGFLNLTDCNYSDPLQLWEYGPDSGTVRLYNSAQCLSHQHKAGDGLTIWAKELVDGFAVAFFNQAADARRMTCGRACMRRLGFAVEAPPATLRMRDLWSHTDNGTVSTEGFTVLVDGQDSTVVVKLTPT